MPFSIIACVDKNYGIGLKNTIPWHSSSSRSKKKGEDFVKKDLQYFKHITENNVVIMGKNTWNSINKKKGLSNRLNIIITSNSDNLDPVPEDIDNIFISNDFNNALKFAYNLELNIFVIGGAQLYKSAINHDDLEYIYINKIDKEYDCDVYFPAISNTFELINCNIEGNISYTIYSKKN